jgi:CheY-specific phosphatase CheX
MANHQQIMASRLRESTEELLESIAIAAWVVDRPTAGAAGRQIASVIGFNGKQARGSLTVRSTMDFFADTHPTAKTTRGVDPDAIVDWASEFSNQLLGRFKNKMLAHGLDFQVGLPVTICGENLIESSVGVDGVVSYQFRTSGHVLCVTFVGRLQADVELSAGPMGRIAARPGKPIDL